MGFDGVLAVDAVTYEPVRSVACGAESGLIELGERQGAKNETTACNGTSKTDSTGKAEKSVIPMMNS